MTLAATTPTAMPHIRPSPDGRGEARAAVTAAVPAPTTAGRARSCGTSIARNIAGAATSSADDAGSTGASRPPTAVSATHATASTPPAVSQ